MEIIKYLIGVNLTVFMPDRKGNLPLHYAFMKLNINCGRILIRASGKSYEENLNCKNKFGVAPIDILLKLFNKLREPGEPEYEADKIIDYIKDKQLVPNK
jgi:hypothetical protein